MKDLPLLSQGALDIDDFAHFFPGFLKQLKEGEFQFTVQCSMRHAAQCSFGRLLMHKGLVDCWAVMHAITQ